MPGLPDAVRRHAEALLRHYPGSGDVAAMAELLPSVLEVRGEPTPTAYGKAYWWRVLSRGLLFSLAVPGVLYLVMWLAVRYHHP
jgi:hypothetical protein